MENKTVEQNTAEISATKASETSPVPEHLSFERWEDIGTPKLDWSPESIAASKAQPILTRDMKIKRIEALDWHGDVSSMCSMLPTFMVMIDEGLTDEQLQEEIEALI